jgi:hypothetical protein
MTVINKEQQEKIEILKQQQEDLGVSIKQLEESLKAVPDNTDKLLTSQLTNEGEEARRKYFNGNVGILCNYTDLAEYLERYEADCKGFFKGFRADDPYPYRFHCDSAGWKYAHQAKPQKGVWYWREDENDVPPDDSLVAVLFKKGTTSSAKSLIWCWGLGFNDINIIAYMLLD